MNILRTKNKEDDKIVIIKPLAYYKMLLHVLRFGNKLRKDRENVEVMGMLVGYLEGEGEIKNVIVMDSIPTSHGGSIEVQFTQDDYIPFEIINVELAKDNMFIVGWYHSHPGLFKMDIYFSVIDIVNQTGWQGPNPSAIAIVFDHEYLDKPGNLGFRTFRLEDPINYQDSGIYEVKTIVEPPNDFGFYIKIVDLINKVHLKEPLILEHNENPDPIGDIYIPTEKELMAKEPEMQVNSLIHALQSGISQFIEISVKSFIQFLNTWSQEVVKEIMRNNLQMREDLITMKESVSEGVINFQNEFKSKLTYAFDNFKRYIDDIFEDFDKSQEDIKNKLNQLKEEIDNQLKNVFQEHLEKKVEVVLTLFDDQSINISEFNNLLSENGNILEKQQTSLKNVSEKMKSLENITITEIKTFSETIKNSSSKSLNNVSIEIDSLKQHFNTHLSELEKFTTDLKESREMIKNKIKTIESEKKDLQRKLKKFNDRGD